MRLKTRQMCGRYTMSDPERVIDEFSIVDRRPVLEPRFNIAPSQGVWVLLRTAGEGPSSELMRWGWTCPALHRQTGDHGEGRIAGDEGHVQERVSGPAMLVSSGRLLRMAAAGKRSLPYFIGQKKRAPFAMAGIWQPPAHDESQIASCAIVTRPATSALTVIHHRMPAVLAPRHHEAWLDPSNADCAHSARSRR